METRAIQQAIMQNKQAHGFNTDNVEKEFLFLYGEVAEAVQAYKFENRENLGAELADVGIYLLGLSEMLGFDLGQEIEQKMSRNQKRIYKRQDNGYAKRISEE